MSGFAEINQEMAQLSQEIETLSGQLEEKRTDYEQKKHAFDLTYSGFIMSGKLENPEWTQTDIQAYAIKQSSQAKIDMIMAHGVYRKLKAELSAKQGKLDTVKERGWNFRQELKRISY